MDWADVPFFLAISETRSLAGAARRLGVNHSTVFRRLNGLERRVGKPLFERLADGYVLTAVGEQILPLIQEAEQALLAAERTVAGGDFRLTGRLRITADAHLAAPYLAPAVAAFSREHPGIQVQVTVTDRPGEVVRYGTDVVLRETAAPDPQLPGRQALAVPWFAMASRRYLRNHPRPERLADLGQHRLVGGSDRLLRFPAIDWLRRNQPPELFTCSADELDSLAALATAGMGVVFLPGDRASPDLVELFALPAAMATELWIQAHPDLAHQLRVRTFGDFLFNFLREHARLARFVRPAR